MRAPSATYRLQFNRDFRFADALPLVDYLGDLGISHVYASPVLQAASGSTHGYDVADPTRVNPELGTEEEFVALADALRQRGMSLLLDIVPNHMAASPQNPWWREVLARGQESPYAGFFDIDWERGGGKVVLPMLGKPLDDALAAGELAISEPDGEAVLRYYETALPLAEGTARGGLREVLQRQHYRLVYWREGARQLNYRRFFNISALVGVRVEDPQVFAATHAKVLDIVRAGRADGLRIDHIDGLRDPQGYLQHLQDALREASGAGEPFYVVVEKITAPGERLTESWPVAGTTGYDFLDALNGVFVQPDGLARLGDAYARTTGDTRSYEDVAYEAKKLVMRNLFPGEMEMLGAQLAALAQADEPQLPAEDLRRALTEITACLLVYRTYIRERQVSASDRAVIEAAVTHGRARAPEVPDAAWEYARRVLTLDGPGERADAWLAFVMRWQQYTGPVAAKGVEDTAFYRYNRLISLNEVGADPGAGTDGLDAFHRANEEGLTWPHKLNATSTHDTKRSEDVRARLNVLSELPGEWARTLAAWTAAGERLKTDVRGRRAPDRNEEVMLYQSLLGAWPLDDGERPEFRRRLVPFIEKALREAKVNTSWLDPDEAYETAVQSFVDRLLGDDTFLAQMRALLQQVEVPGAVNSLSQVLLKVASPGVPDFYRGSELWDLSLVDPDNRRPVDFALRARLLAELLARDGDDTLLPELLNNWRDGRMKLYTTWKALTFRAEHRALFEEGEYIPLDAGEHAIAFARRRADAWAIAIAPHFVAAMCEAVRFPLGDVWGDATVRLPDAAPRTWRNAFNDVLTTGDGSLRLAAIFARFPVALLAST